MLVAHEADSMIQIIRCSTVDTGNHGIPTSLGARVWLGMVVASILRTSKDDEQVTWPAKYSHPGPYETVESAMGAGQAA
ncbi:hypothetical protein PTKU15_94640 (plasmid) [Paraburkholderia terrae]|nr:hypothetical protein PTKU15_94640 [Paraburkholderia terrae]